MAVAPGVRRLRAPNPSPMTADGTNTYLLGEGEAMVVDPGPDDPRHLRAILGALGGRRVAAILVTHFHPDHGALAPRLARETGAPVLAWGGATEGLRPLPAAFGQAGGAGAELRPDRRLAHGEVVEAGGIRLRALHTPGHLGSHLCLDAGDWVLTGDHVMGWSSTVVAPPEGDMGDYLDSLRLLAALGPRRYLPGHGGPVEDGPARAAALLAHREAREAEVLAALAEGPRAAGPIAAALYGALPPAAAAAGRATVLAHLLHLWRRGRVRPVGAPGPDAAFRLA